MINLTSITCPDECTDVLLFPAIAAEQDCTGYEQTLSQVSDLYILPSDTGDIFTDWSSTAANATPGAGVGVDNTNDDNTKAKWLVGIGGVAEPEEIITEYPKLQRKVTERKYTLTFRVPNLVQEMYDFLRQLQCGDTGFTFYYADLATYVYGVEGGLAPESVDVDFPHGAGNDDKNVAIITLTWTANGDPDRHVNTKPETA
jgi:hypothetical protein